MTEFKKFINSIDLASVSVGTWVRLAMMIITMVVFIAKMLGVEIPMVDENTVAEIIVLIFGVISFLQSYWKNNSFTKSAQAADEFMVEKKGEM